MLRSKFFPGVGGRGRSPLECATFVVAAQDAAPRGQAPAHRAHHFATLLIYVIPSLCVSLLPVVSLGPPEGGTTHHGIVWYGMVWYGERFLSRSNLPIPARQRTSVGACGKRSCHAARLPDSLVCRRSPQGCPLGEPSCLRPIWGCEGVSVAHCPLGAKPWHPG